MKTCFLSLLVFAVGERLDAVERVVGIRHRLRAAADGQGGSGGVVAVRHLAHGMAALIEGCGTHQGAAGVEVGAHARGLTTAGLTRCREIVELTFLLKPRLVR